jgi:hypothetical protein
LRREENRRTRRKTLEARERINNNLNSHMTPSPGIEPEITLVIGERLAATPPMLSTGFRKIDTDRQKALKCF